MTKNACITGGFLLLSTLASAQGTPVLSARAPLAQQKQVQAIHRIASFNPQQRLPVYRKMVAAAGQASTPTNIQVDKAYQLTVAQSYVDGSWMVLRKLKNDGNDIVRPEIHSDGRSSIEVWNGNGTSAEFLEVSLKTAPGKNYLIMLNASGIDPYEPRWLLNGDLESEVTVQKEQGIWFSASGARTTFMLRFKGGRKAMATQLDSIEVVPLD